MAIRLNKLMREQILTSIIDATFKKRIEAAEAAKAQMAVRVYDACMPAEFKAVKGNKGWFATYRNFQPYRLNQSERKEFFTFGALQYLTAHDYKPVTYAQYVNSGNAVCLEVKDEPLIADLLALEAATKAIQDETAQLTEQVKGLLLSVPTIEKFKEIAPELADYVPAGLCNAGSSTALTVNVGGLVQQLMAAGLKVPK